MCLRATYHRVNRPWIGIRAEVLDRCRIETASTTKALPWHIDVVLAGEPPHILDKNGVEYPVKYVVGEVQNTPAPEGVVLGL